MSRVRGTIAMIGAMAALAAPALQSPPLRSKYSTSTHWLGGGNRRRWARDNLPRGYPGAKLARKAMLGQLTLRR